MFLQGQCNVCPAYTHNAMFVRPTHYTLHAMFVQAQCYDCQTYAQNALCVHQQCYYKHGGGWGQGQMNLWTLSDQHRINLC
jgi:hypothetical protein